MDRIKNVINIWIACRHSGMKHRPPRNIGGRGKYVEAPEGIFGWLLLSPQFPQRTPIYMQMQSQLPRPKIVRIQQTPDSLQSGSYNINRVCRGRRPRIFVSSRRFSNWYSIGSAKLHANNFIIGGISFNSISRRGNCFLLFTCYVPLAQQKMMWRSNGN